MPATAAGSRLLSSEDAVRFWNSRHAQESTLRAGGHRGLDAPSNEIFYAHRLALLAEILGHLTSPSAPFEILDAGCGTGWFARALARFGHRLEGIDTSECAIEAARAAGGGPTYAVSALAQWSSPWLYDAVVSIDVLFHVLDDAPWAASVANLASLVRLGGRLVLSDAPHPCRSVHGEYIVHRPPAMYAELLGTRGFGLRGIRPFAFLDNEVAFLDWIRVS